MNSEPDSRGTWRDAPPNAGSGRLKTASLHGNSYVKTHSPIGSTTIPKSPRLITVYKKENLELKTKRY